MQNREKIAVGVLVASAVILVVYLALPGNEQTTKNQAVMEVPPPETITLADYRQRSSDPAPAPSAQGQSLSAMEYELITAGYQARIAEHKKTVQQAQIDIERARAELEMSRQLPRDEPAYGYSHHQVAMPPPASSESVPTPERTLIVNAFNPDGSALVTISGTVYHVVAGDRVGGVAIGTINTASRQVSARGIVSGDTVTVALRPESSRVVADVAQLSAEQP